MKIQLLSLSRKRISDETNYVAIVCHFVRSIGLSLKLVTIAIVNKITISPVLFKDVTILFCQLHTKPRNILASIASKIMDSKLYITQCLTQHYNSTLTY